MPAGFTKRRSGPDADDFFATEAAGLAWLAVPGGPPTPAVLAHDAGSITLERIAAGAPSAPAAEELGRRLAVLHAAGAPTFGAAPPGAPRTHGWIGDAEMTYTPPGAPGRAFGVFLAEERVLATARAAFVRGGLTADDLGEVERFADDLCGGRVDVGPPEPVARLHGDLWSGNVVWSTDGQAWLIDPAAHGGHRESDLAMLALFGTPYLDRIIGAYDEAAPLADGWRARVVLHQVWPLLVHAALFGRGYGMQALAAIRQSPRT